MTTEVAILNPVAVVLAADSALTVRRGKNRNYYHGVNKIFGLKTHHPVAMMIYGEPNFMGVPWETIMKAYRDSLRGGALETLEEYCCDFFKFVEVFLQKHKDDIEDVDVYTVFCEELCALLARRAACSGARYFRGRQFSHADVCSYVDKKVVSIIEKVEAFLMTYTPIDVYREGLETILEEAFGRETKDVIVTKFSHLNVASDPKITARLQSVIIKMCAIGMGFQETSGIVIAGFGANELFPRLFNYSVCSFVNGSLIKYRRSRVEIGRDMKASVLPFGNTDVINTFLHGISRQFRGEFAENTLERFNARTNGKVRPKREIFDEIANAMQGKWEARLFETIALLPKQTLAELAENLISLSAMRSNIYDADGATGGPSSIAVISKGDGLVWVKRQNYFSPELNQHFLARYSTQKSNDA